MFHRNNRHNNKKKDIKKESKYRPSMHELLSFFDGLNTKDGLIIIMCANDPSKIFKTNNNGLTVLERYK